MKDTTDTLRYIMVQGGCLQPFVSMVFDEHNQKSEDELTLAIDFDQRKYYVQIKYNDLKLTHKRIGIGKDFFIGFEIPMLFNQTKYNLLLGF